MNTFETSLTPAYYGLTLFDNSIGIEMHQDAFRFLQEISWNTAPIINDCIRKYNLREFTPPIEGSCGFNNVLTLGKSPRPNWIMLQFALPKFKTTTGTGETSVEDILALRATLYAFLSLGLYFFKGTTDSDFHQLMKITSLELPAQERQYAAGNLFVSISPATVTWLAKQDDRSNFDLLENLLRKAYIYMWEPVSLCDRFSVVFTPPKKIRFDFPNNMNACGLMPSNSFSPNPLTGYTIVGNNMDSGLEQFAGLALLAAWHTLMRLSDKKKEK